MTVLRTWVSFSNAGFSCSSRGARGKKERGKLCRSSNSDSDDGDVYGNDDIHNRLLETEMSREIEGARENGNE